MEDRSEIQKNWHQAANETLYWNQMSNDRLSEINKNLLGLVTILLPLTGSILALTKQLNDVQKTLMIGGWIFLFISIVAGFSQIYVDAKFFKGYCDYNATRSEIYHKKLDKNTKNDETDIQNIKKPEASSGHLSLIFQGISFFIGLLLIMGIIFIFLISK